MDAGQTAAGAAGAAWRVPVIGGGIAEPVAPVLQRRLRRAVLDHATGEQRRVFPPLLHLGSPGEHVVRLCDDLPDDVLDHALRTDMAAALLHRAHRRGSTTLAWLSRRGDLAETADVDLAWLAAVRAAAAERGLLVPFVLVNRRAWRDPVSGTGRAWRRLRAR